MPSVSIPASLYGAVNLSMARGVSVTLDTTETLASLLVYHGLGASCFPFPRITPSSTWPADVSMPVKAHLISYDATVALFFVTSPLAAAADADIGTKWDVVCEVRNSLAR